MSHIRRLSNGTVQNTNQITNTLVETAFADISLVGANALSGQGQGHGFQLTIYGYISSKSSSPGTLVLKIRWGSTVLATFTITLTTSMVSVPFKVTAYVQVCTTGTSGKVDCNADFTQSGVAPVIVVPIGLGTAGQITVNTQIQQSLNMTATFSVADVANIVTVTKNLIEEIY